jgi:hypothetical protein
VTLTIPSSLPFSRANRYNTGNIRISRRVGSPQLARDNTSAKSDCCKLATDANISSLESELKMNISSPAGEFNLNLS